MATHRTIPISDAYKERLNDEKQAKETWEEFLERATGIPSPSRTEADA